MKKQYAVGMDIGGTNFRIGTVDAAGKTVHFEKSSSRIFQGTDAVSRLAERIKDYLAAHNLNGQVLGVGIGVPSVVSRDGREILSTPNLSAFCGTAFYGKLEKALALPLLLDRDVNFLLQEDIRGLHLPTQEKTVAGFYIGTGIGNAICMNGKIYRGKNGAAGELGHIPLYGVEEVCTCGNLSCAETRMSGRYLETLCAKYFPQTEVHFVFELHKNHEILQQYVQELALPIATEINILDPDAVLLSGGVLSMPSFPKKTLTDAIRKYCRKPFPAENLELHFVEHTAETAVRGCGLCVHQAFRKAMQ